MNELALFAGAGGGILGGRLLGWHTVGAVEIERYPRKVLLHQQELGNLPRFPIWDDVSTFDGKPWRGLVDVVSGGFPCQDISCAGKGAGITGARSGLWAEMHRIICEVRPRYAFMENSPVLAARGLGRVLGDLAESGYDAAWLVLGAADVGAPHRRARMWILAHDSHAYGVPGAEQEFSHHRPEVPDGCGSNELDAGGDLADTHLPGCEQQWRTQPAEAQHADAERCGWWSFEPRVGRVADGVAARVDRLKCLGNGQVPLVAASAFKILEKILLKNDGREFVYTAGVGCRAWVAGGAGCAEGEGVFCGQAAGVAGGADARD